LEEEGVITIGSHPLTIYNLNLLFMETQVIYYDVFMKAMEWGELIIVSHDWLPLVKKDWVDLQFRIRSKSDDYGSLYLVLNNGIVIKENEVEKEDDIV
jgi:hypothetical protein